MSHLTSFGWREALLCVCLACGIRVILIAAGNFSRFGEMAEWSKALCLGDRMDLSSTFTAVFGRGFEPHSLHYYSFFLERIFGDHDSVRMGMATCRGLACGFTSGTGWAGHWHDGDEQIG